MEHSHRSRPALSPNPAPTLGPDLSVSERLESLKVGTVAALTALATAIAGQTLVPLILSPPLLLALDPPLTVWGWSGCLRLGAIALTGFMFGVTYRYAIRRDHNPHLRSGAVAAFVLVRALAQVDHPDIFRWPSPAAVSFLFHGLESVVLFGLGAVALHRGFAKGWLKLA